MDYCTFMKGLCNAYIDTHICIKCGGTGYAPVMCCSGHMCGCKGMPVDFEECECGSEKVSEDQIKEWAEESNN